MSNQVVRPPNSVRSAYEAYLEAFRSAAEDANRSVVFPAIPLPSCFTQGEDASTVMFKRCVYLKDWPSRRLSRSKRLDVIIKALELFNKTNWSLTKSTVYVNYFVVADASAELVQALHYDFVDGGQIDHPFFHLQLDNTMISGDDLTSAGFGEGLNLSEHTNECWVTTRIPTPEMTLASVLYCLVADHLGTTIFRQFADRFHAIQQNLPLCAFEAMKSSFQKIGSHLKSSHWFAHMHDN
jgi:hypothetical protein